MACCKLSLSNYPEETLTPKAPTTPPVVLDPPPTGLTQGKGIKILPPNQMLQKLLILLAEVQAGNMSENLLN